MDFSVSKFLRQAIYFWVGFLGVALFSFASSQRAAAVFFSSAQPLINPSQEVSLWRNPSHQELNFYP